MKNGLHDFKRLSSLEFVSIECLFNLFRGNARGNVEGREWNKTSRYLSKASKKLGRKETSKWLASSYEALRSILSSDKKLKWEIAGEWEKYYY